MSGDLTSNALLPCPFCGGTARMATEHDPDGMTWHYITCGKCGARSRGKWHSPGNDCPVHRAEVRDEWNRRAADEPDDLLADLREIEGELMCAGGVGHRCSRCDNSTYDLSQKVRRLIDRLSPVETAPEGRGVRDNPPPHALGSSEGADTHSRLSEPDAANVAKPHDDPTAHRVADLRAQSQPTNEPSTVEIEEQNRRLAEQVDQLEAEIERLRASEPPKASSCEEPEPCVSHLALKSFETKLRQLSQAMGNPAVEWDEDGSLEEALIDEAIRRLAEEYKRGFCEASAILRKFGPERVLARADEFRASSSVTKESSRGDEHACGECGHIECRSAHETKGGQS